MKRAALIFTYLLVAATPGAAAESYALMGLGTGSCSDFARMYRLDPEDADIKYFSWAQGFMSGLNASRLMEKQIIKNLGAMPVQAQERMLRTYCDQHPLGIVEDAVMNLYIALPIVSP